MRKERPDQVTEQVELGFEPDYLPLKTVLIFLQLEDCLFKIHLLQKVNQITHNETGSEILNDANI